MGTPTRKPHNKRPLGPIKRINHSESQRVKEKLVVRKVARKPKEESKFVIKILLDNILKI